MQIDLSGSIRLILQKYRKPIIIVVLFFICYFVYQYTRYTKLGIYLNMYVPNNKEVHINLEKILPFKYDEIFAFKTMGEDEIDRAFQAFGYPKGLLREYGKEYINDNLGFQCNVFLFKGRVVYCEIYSGTLLWEGGLSQYYEGIVEFDHKGFEGAPIFHTRSHTFLIIHTVEKNDYGDMFNYFNLTPSVDSNININYNSRGSSKAFQ